jgi:hypothetical protein
MTKANLELPNGTKVQIDGSVEDIAQLLATFADGGRAPVSGPKATPRRKSGASKRQAGSSSRKPSKTGPRKYIRELIAEGYFKTKQNLGDVQRRLEERGHIYAQESLSGPILQLTKAGELRRLKQGGKGPWQYVNP